MIYICTHKDFLVPEFVTKDNYTIITDGTKLHNKYPCNVINAKNELEPLKHALSEGYQIYDIWKRNPNYEWIGINHYRRYFLPTDEKINIIPRPLSFNVYNQYQACHNIEDWVVMLRLLDKLHPEMHAEQLPDVFFPCNCCILRHEIFDQWCSFLFEMVNAFNEFNQLKSDADVHHFVEGKLKRGEYQERIHGFLLERLSTVFWVHYFNKHPNDLKIRDLHMIEL